MSRANRYLEAFKENFNTVGMASALALSAAMLNPLPLLVGLVAEAAYLLFVPDTKWYAARLAKRFDSEVEARRQEIRDGILPTLRPEMRERFKRLEETRKQIDAQSQDDRDWFREVLRKLDYLLEKFLQFAARDAQFRAYLEELRDEVRGTPREAPRPPARGKPLEFDIAKDWVEGRDIPRRKIRNGGREEEPPAKARPAPAPDPDARRIQTLVAEVQAHYEKEQASVATLLEGGPDEDTRAILEKRADVLQRRHEFAGKIGRILLNISHQLSLLEDTFGLINDEIRARTPEQVLADIEEVVVATNTMASALEELAPYEALASGGR